MLQPTKMRYDKAGPKVVEKLNRRHFDAYYCSTREEAIEKVLELIPETDSVSWGGTMTVDELGIKDMLRARGNTLIDRDTAANMDERMDIMRQGLTCDTFLMSSNAITEDGCLVNMDGTGNRVAALIYGPEKVIVLAGMNKIVPDVEAGIARTRTVAAPMNAQRFPGQSPCRVNGRCADCKSTDSICASLVITRLCKIPGRIHVILIGEDMGM